MKRINRHYVYTVAKTAVAVGIFYILFKKGAIEFRPLAELAINHPLLILVSAMLLMGGLLVSAARWWILLRAAQIPLAITEVVRLYLIGAFFSTWLPGSAGGDMAKAVYLVKGLPARRITAILTIALDRAFALLGLLACATILAMMNRHNREMQPVLTHYVWLTLGALFVCAFLGVVILAAALYLRIDVWPKWAARGRPIAHQLREAIVLIAGHQREIAVCAFLSIGASAMVAIGIAIIGDAFSFGARAFVSALAGVIANISSAIPLTPGGLGIAETVFSKICQELGSPVAPYATIYLAFRLVMVAVSLSGAIFWFMQNYTKRKNQSRLKGINNA